MARLHSSRTVEQIVEDRIKGWSRVPAHEKEARRLPVVAISRQEGSLGEEVGRRLAEEFGMDLYGDRLLDLIADKIHVSKRVVETLDEKGVSFMNDMLAALTSQFGLVSNTYIDVLAKTIATIDWHGNAVIIGRGAAYMLHGPDDLRVRFLAPVETRVRNVEREHGWSRDEAREHVKRADTDRSHFVRHYFHQHYDDVRHFDLVLNNRSLDLETSVAVLKTALERRTRRSS